MAIDLQVLTPTRSLTLNSLGLDLDSAAVDGQAADIGVDAPAQTATFELPTALARGRHRLLVTYRGPISIQATGLYALDYKDAAGANRRALYTQFEPGDARRMFPSFDEPSLKATFSIDAVVPEGLLAVSNMPVASRTPASAGNVHVRFMTTPRMATYVLFFALGDFERAVRKVGSVENGVVVKRGYLGQASLALETSTTLLPWFNAWLGTGYPLPKLDHIVGPGRSEFFGAMENWGAIFYFEYAVLFDPAISTITDKQRIFQVVSHEIAHQWFGDLVTMGWWDDVWLNEGFATWMQHKAAETFHPEWSPTLSATSARDRAMEDDSFVSTHPIVRQIASPNEISQAFDQITYNKGQAVLHMIEAWVGPQKWQAGLRRYIAQHAYGNTRSDDVWAAMEAEAGRPVGSIAHQFTQQPGVPLIRVEDATCTDGGTQLVLSQGEFTADRPDKTPLGWDVPVLVSVGDKTSALQVHGGSLQAKLDGCGLVVVNSGQYGYFRTLYTPALFASLREKYAQLSRVDQFGLLADSWALGLAGDQDPSDALALIATLGEGTDPQVWQRAAGILSDLYRYSQGNSEWRRRVVDFARAKLAPRLASLGWTVRADESDTVTALRSSLIVALGRMGDPAVLTEARRRFAADSSDPIPAAIRKAVLEVVATHADDRTWQRLHSLAEAETVALRRTELWRLLGLSEAPALADAALALAITDGPGATNGAVMIRAVAEHDPDRAFAFAVTHQDAVGSRVDASARPAFIARLASGSSRPETLAALMSYGEASVPSDARQDVANAAAKIRHAMSVIDTRLPEIDHWLVANPPIAAGGAP